MGGEFQCSSHPAGNKKLNYKRNDLATSDTTNSSCENLKLLETRKHPVQCFFLHGRNQLNNRFDPIVKGPPVTFIPNESRSENDQGVKATTISFLKSLANGGPPISQVKALSIRRESMPAQPKQDMVPYFSGERTIH